MENKTQLGYFSPFLTSKNSHVLWKGLVDVFSPFASLWAVSAFSARATNSPKFPPVTRSNHQPASQPAKSGFFSKTLTKQHFPALSPPAV